MSENSHNFIRLLQVGAIVLLVFFFASLAVTGNFHALTYKTGDAMDLSGLVGRLLLASIFLERTIEVFLSLLRSRGADELDNRIKCLKSALERYSDPKEQTQRSAVCIEKTVNDPQQSLQAYERKRVTYRADSRQLAVWSGLFLGIIMAASGIRALEGIFDFSGIDKA
ncbi:MAG: hypothetical protein H7837_10515 [Magnetococcus sp. MYC-9]